MPIDLQEKQQKIEIEMREKLIQKPVISTEAQVRDAKIKAILANIPCMSRETLEENRRKIEQRIGGQNEKKSNQIMLERHHESILNELRSEVIGTA